MSGIQLKSSNVMPVQSTKQDEHLDAVCNHAAINHNHNHGNPEADLSYPYIQAVLA